MPFFVRSYVTCSLSFHIIAFSRKKSGLPLINDDSGDDNDITSYYL